MLGDVFASIFLAGSSLYLLVVALDKLLIGIGAYNQKKQGGFTLVPQPGKMIITGVMSLIASVVVVIGLHWYWI